MRLASQQPAAPAIDDEEEEEEEGVFLPYIRSDGSVAFHLRGSSIVVNGDHLDDDDRLAPEHSHISMLVDDDEEEEEEEVEEKDDEDDEDDGGGDGEEEEDEAEKGVEEAEEEDEDDDATGDVDGGGVLEITLAELRRRLGVGNGGRDADGLLWLGEDDGEDDADYQPTHGEDEDDVDDDDEAADEEQEDDEEADDEEKEEAVRAQPQEAEARAEFGLHPRPARWYGSWPIEGVPMTSPEHLDREAMVAFTQQTRTQSLYVDRYPINTFTHTRQRAAPPPNAPSTSPLSSAYLSAAFVPTVTTQVTEFEARVFCGRFSASGAVYCAASQDGYIHLYDTAGFRLFKRVEARDVGWSVIDVDISHNQARFHTHSACTTHMLPSPLASC